MKLIQRFLKRIDPIHWVYLRGLNKIKDKSIDEDQLGEKQHPYTGPVSADHWSWWPLSRFLARQVEQDIPRNAKVDISGGWFEINGDEVTFPEKRMVQLNEKERLRAGPKLSLSAVSGLLYEAHTKRIYIYGVSLLALGFLMQLIDSVDLLATISGYL